MVFSTNRTDYTRSTNQTWDDADSVQKINITRLLGAVAVIYFDESKISKMEANFGGATYQIKDFISATALSASSDKAHNLSLSEINDADSATLNIERGEDFFGFDSDYMLYAIASSNRTGGFTSVNTNMTEYSYDYDTIIFAGVETVDNNIPTSGTIGFGGAGKGIYGVLDGDNSLKKYNTSFAVTVDINFSSRIANCSNQ